MNTLVSELLSEQRLKSPDDLLNMIDHVMDRFEQRLTLNNPRFVEHYLEERLNLLIQFRIAEIDEDFVALFSRTSAVSGMNHGVVGDDVISVNGLETVHAVQSGCGCYYETVLVDVVQLVEPPERFVPSLVRLGTVDSISRHLRHALYFSLTRVGGFVFFGGFDIKDRKVNVPLVPLREPSALIVNKAPDSDKLIGKMIESGANVEKDFAGDSSNRVGDRFDFGKVIDAVRAGLRLYLAADYIGGGRKIGLDFGIEIVDVLFGPFDLHSDKRDSFVSGHD
jgi:hypothetical protein